MRKKRILIVAAHPDDEILGCGATVARLVNEGAEAFTMILGEGATSRDEKRNPEKYKEEISLLKNNIKEANRIIGINKTFSFDFPDNRFDSVPLLDIVKVIESVKIEIQPDVIFTHFGQDMNIDHQITNQAVLTSTRPMVGESVKEIYAFEVLSSTEWNYPLSFNPDVYFDVSSTIKQKIESMDIYTNELRAFPHPRSLKAIELNSEYWGIRTGLGNVEAFKSLRVIK